METTSDKLKSLLYALLVHGACVVVMILGVTWTQAARPISVAGVVIEASLVSAPASYKPPQPTAEQRKRAEAERREKQLEQKRRAEQAAEQQRQDQVERERVAALALEQADAAKREQEERNRQEQVDLTQRLEEEKQKNVEDERLKQLADIRKQREAAAAEREKEELRLAKLQDQRRQQDNEKQKALERERMREMLEAERRQQGNEGEDDSLMARYKLAVQQAVYDRWNRPETAQPGLLCTIHIIQIPGGEVIQAVVSRPCNADDVVRTSIEQAVMKATPLPYEGYEKVFTRDITFNFRYDG